MNSRRRYVFGTIALATAVLTSAGCATGVAFDPQVQPPLRIGQSRIVFYVAKSSVLAHGIRRRLYIDGQPYAEIELGQYVVVDTAPGLRRVMLRPVREEANKDVLSSRSTSPWGKSSTEGSSAPAGTTRPPSMVSCRSILPSRKWVG